MSIVLEKGARINLQKEAPGVSKFYLGLHWSENKFDTGHDFDADVSAFALSGGKLTDDRNFVFYNSTTTLDGKPCTPCQGVVHSGDNRTGAAEGDDEVLIFDTSKIAPNIDEISIVVTIHDADARKQNFGQIRDIGVNIKELDTGKQLASFDLADAFSTETAVQIGSLEKKDGTWRFVSVGAGYKRGLGDFVKAYQ